MRAQARPFRRPAVAEKTCFTVHDASGRLVGRIEGRGVTWRAFVWQEAAGEHAPIPGAVPSEAAARTALMRRAAR